MCEKNLAKATAIQGQLPHHETHKAKGLYTDIHTHTNIQIKVKHEKQYVKCYYTLN